MQDEDQAGRELVAKACRILGKQGLTNGVMGHVSLRSADGKHILIRGKGFEEVGMRYTAPEHVVKVDLDGKAVEAERGVQAPSEVYIHTWLYRRQPETRSVTHIHPQTAMLLTVSRKGLQPLIGGYDPDMLMLALDEIPVYGRSVTITDDALGQEFAAAMGAKRACLMRGHGITTAGASVEEATITAIKIGELAEINYRAHLLGDAEPISDEDIAEFRRRAAKTKEGKGLARHAPGARLASAWRFQSQICGEE